MPPPSPPRDPRVLTGDDGWSGYLRSFHADRAGITERLLLRSTAEGATPYDWLLEAVPQGRVLDLACGSAPLWPSLAGRSWVGIDLSDAELRLARTRGAGPLAVGSSATLPLADRSVDVVVVAMALMLMTPLAATLSDIARVLVPGGTLVATVPAARPLHLRDLLVLAPLIRDLGIAPGYPGDRELAHADALCGAAGLRLASDERRRFAFATGGAAGAGAWFDSLYLPGVDARRLGRARERVTQRAPATLPVPIRRLVATLRE